MAWTASGEEGWINMPPARGKRHRRDLLAQLARLPLNVEKSSADLLAASRNLVEVASTPVLITPGDAQVTLSDQLRSGLVVLNSTSPQVRRWFQFPPNVDFARCMPTDQEPKTETKRRRRDAKSNAVNEKVGV
jgi:uncharacterized protein (DUF58 family)